MISRHVDRPWFPGPQAWMLLVLIALNLAPGLPARLGILRGVERIEDELDEVRALGYYEGLLDALDSAEEPAPQAEALPKAQIAIRRGPNVPPPASVPFRDAGLAEPDPGYLLLRLRPSLDVPWNGTTFRTNALGYRGPDAEPTKPPGTFRVVVLGSSNTMGHGVEDEATYVRHLERWLDDRAGPGRRVEVLNLAVSSYAPTQRLHLLRTEVEALAPDWILADASALDLYLEEHHLCEVVRRGAKIPYPFVREALAKAGVSPADSPDDFGRKLRRVYPELLDGTYAGWAGEARRLGVPLTVVILPRADSKAESPGIVGLIRDSARRHDLACHDLSGAFHDLTLDELRVSDLDSHPSVLGHRRIFDHLRTALDRQESLPDLLAQNSN